MLGMELIISLKPWGLDLKSRNDVTEKAKLAKGSLPGIFPRTKDELRLWREQEKLKLKAIEKAFRIVAMAEITELGKSERDEVLIAYCAEHPEVPLAVVGKMFGISKQRVHQVLKAAKQNKGLQGGDK